MSQKSKKELILDAGEELFAKQGYMNVTLRMVAAKAGFDIPILNYHFGNKRLLLDAILNRRIGVINEDRLQLLDNARKAAGNKSPNIRAVIEAQIYPLFRRCINCGPEWTNYLLLSAQIGSIRQYGDLVHSLYDPVTHHFISAMRLAIPEAGEKEIYWYHQFLYGALCHTLSDTGRLDLLSDNKYSSSDFRTAYEQLIVFLVYGFAGLAGKNQALLIDAEGEFLPETLQI